MAKLVQNAALCHTAYCTIQNTCSVPAAETLLAEVLLDTYLIELLSAV